MDSLQHDIDRYVRGEMSPAEMHALEKKALSDPFLADALEGAMQLSAEEFSTDASWLHEEVKKRASATERSITYWVVRIAAGVSIVAVASYLIFYGSSERRFIAENSVQKQDTTIEMDKDGSTSSDANASGDTLYSEHKETAETTNSSEKARDKNEDVPSSAASPLATVTIEEPAVVVEPSRLAEDAATMAADTLISLGPKLVFVEGVVKDPIEGKGLPGVNVFVKGTTIGTITDEEGRYRIALDSLSRTLQFSFIGYTQKELNIASADKPESLDVVLEQDVEQLSEVVVVGYGLTKRKTRELNPILELAQPSGGRGAFKEYLKDSLRYPQQALNSKVQGKVTIQFTVGANGATSDYKVLKGLGYGCDEEVIRLIKEGPKWTPSKKDDQVVTEKVKVRIRFKLPKK
jgi:TonB family protein